MKAMVLAAGRGTRLRPLTLETPKPLLEAGQKTLIEYQLEKLKKAGITEVVINLHHLGDKIEEQLSDGSEFGLKIIYSREDELLETGGGILHALPILGEEPFVCVSGDTYSEFDFRLLPASLPTGSLGVMVMTRNPPHHPKGDFHIGEDGVLELADHQTNQPTVTYAGVAVFSPELVQGEKEKAFALRQVFDKAIEAGSMRGIYFDGYWCDVGTVERLEELRSYLQK